jgi:hypothetical protein
MSRKIKVSYPPTVLRLPPDEALYGQIPTGLPPDEALYGHIPRNFGPREKPDQEPGRLKPVAPPIAPPTMTTADYAIGKIRGTIPQAKPPGKQHTKPLSPITQHFLDRVREENWWDRLDEPRQFPDLPCGKEMHCPALIWAAMQKGWIYHTPDLKRFLIDFYALNREQRAYRLKRKAGTAFANYVAWLTAYWTNPRSKEVPPFHQKIGVGRYLLTRPGRYEAEMVRRALGEKTWQGALDRLKADL